jgi:hypothetical protein
LFTQKYNILTKPLTKAVLLDDIIILSVKEGEECIDNQLEVLKLHITLRAALLQH